MLNHDHSQLIRLLSACAESCELCATACLQELNVKMMSRCIGLDRDCADMCRLAAALLQRNSPIGHQFLLLCEEICHLCGHECGRHPMDHCQNCAIACRACADACHAHHEMIVQQ